MKAGVAVQLRLAATLAEPNRDVTYVFYECEEVDAERNGLFLLSRERARAARRPTSPCCSSRAAAWSRAAARARCARRSRATGARAHTATLLDGEERDPRGGRDPGRSCAPGRRGKPVVDGLEYHEGLNAVAISGGVAGNVVPDECVVTVNYRFAPDRSEQEAAGYIRDLFSPLAGRDPGRRPRRAPRPDRAARPPRSSPPWAAAPRAKLGWTDVARFAELGIPAVNYGPGISEIAHTPGEYVETAQITAAERRLRSWLARLRPTWPTRSG